MPPLVILTILAAFAYLAVTLVVMLSGKRGGDVERIKRRLASVTEKDVVVEFDLDIVKKHQLSDLPWLNTLLFKQKWSRKLDRILDQADIQAPLAVFMLLALALASGGFLFAYLISRQILASLAGAVIMGVLPFWWIRLKKRRRMGRFEEQLPEALDLVARALKAGHTFGSGMAMVGSEFEAPISVEFNKTIEEINFGVNLLEALDNLLERVDCPDLNFFVVSIKIQSETGGNLAEIVENISRLIRERFKLKGKVRVLSAEGRFAAIVLLLLPFGVAGAIYALNPDFMEVLFTTETGKTLSYIAMGLMTMGIIVIRKMIRIEV
jgi:tight adherence protein B